ncbi:hypothetical protein ACFY6U_52075 [Streptomyces sp. NPDC013157]|uniref:hypothetical protein n=1 Tax=Streptomyces sp. NPDC013157 TaxID=3364861 RepID=UPI0036A791EB
MNDGQRAHDSDSDDRSDMLERGFPEQPDRDFSFVEAVLFQGVPYRAGSLPATA